MLFKGLKFGKKKNNEKADPSTDDAATTQIAELEEQLKERTDDLMQTEERLKKLSGKVDNIVEVDAIPLKPHGPIGELSIVPEDSLEGVDTDDEEEDISDKSEEEPEDIIVVETKAKSIPPASKKKPDKQLDADSLKALFTSEEEEENPLVSLINSLPDVTVDELMDDLKEIKDIIRDWQKK